MVEEDPTSRFYTDNASTYADHCSNPSEQHLKRFVAQLDRDAHILELGCGNGRDSAWMLKHGFRVTTTDGTPEMAAEASRRLGVDVGVLRFEDLDIVEVFDGVWANACLLHVPRIELGGVLARIHKALREHGVFYASYKAGEGEGWDSLGRYYNYPSADWLFAQYQDLPWSSVTVEECAGSAYDRRPTTWLHVLATKP